MKFIFKALSIFFLFNTSIIFADEIKGSAWIGRIGEDGHIQVLLFDKNETFSYLNVVSVSGGEGSVFGDEDDSWELNGNRLVISFNGGYMLCSLTRDNRSEFSGTCINKPGRIHTINLEKIKVTKNYQKFIDF